MANVVRRVWRSICSLHTEERPSACELCAKTFSSGNNLKMHMKAHAGWRPYFWRRCWHMQMLCKSFLMSEEFEVPRGHYFLEKGFLNVKSVLNCFLVDTTWRCTWKPTLSESLPNADIEEIVTNISSKPQSWRHISFSAAERRVKSVTPHKRNAHGHVNNVLR